MRKSKRITAMLCAAALCVGVCQLPAQSGGSVKLDVHAAQTHDPDLVMWYTSQAGTHSKDNAWDNAESFYRALPLGNGRIGAMVYGNCPTEWIDLNECTVWSAGPGSNDREGAAGYLKEVQSLLSAGKYQEANDIIGSKMIGGGQAKYQKVGMLKLSMGHENVSDYTRQLDMNTAVASTTYTHGGKRYVRESFVSYPDQVMVTRITCDQAGSVSVGVGYDGLLNGSVAVDGDTVVATGHGDDDCWTRGAVYYAARTKVIPQGGNMTAGNGTLQVNGADSVMLVTAIRTNFIDAQTCNGDEKGDAAKDMQRVAGMTYDELYERHAADFSSLIHRVDLDLGGDSTVSNSKTVETRIEEFGKSNDPKMVEMLYQYGRYLMISASRDAQAMNLQGIWNKYSAPAWGSKATTNINYEMNYWPALTTNLEECFVPFVEKAKALTISGSKTAMTQYGIDKGWVLHHNTDLWNRSGPIDGTWGLWPTGGAWISNMLYDAYLFNQDEAYLEEIYPVIKGSAEFLNELMIQQEISGQNYMVISPSASPELGLPGYAWDANVHCSYSTTMDNAITRELFQGVTQASAQLGVDTQLRSQLEQKLSLIKPPTVGKHGQLMEWAYDWDNPNETHRHISHIYGLFPGNEYSVSTNPEIAQAAKTSLEHRGDMGTGWSEAWKLNCWARLEDGEHAYNLVKLLITPVNGTESGRLYANLWDAHPPFQIDGNFGFTSGVTEMLLQSQNNEISLIPALPAAWSTGHVNGLCARGNFEIKEMSWENGRLTGVTVLSKSGNVCNLRYGNARVSFETEKDTEYRLDGMLRLIDKTQELGNTARNKTADASEGTAAAAFDGSKATAWEAAKGTTDNWISVDLGKETAIDKWTVVFGGGNFNARDFRLQTSNDGTTWTDADVLYGNTKTTVTRPLAASARYFRLEIMRGTRNNDGGAKVCELELWGASDAPTGIDPYDPPIEAEDSHFLFGSIQIESSAETGRSDLGFIQDGCAFALRDVDFSRGASSFTVSASSAGSGGQLEIHSGSEDGPIVGTCTIDVTGDWQDYQDFTCKTDVPVGVQDLYFVCKGDDGYLFNIDKFSFTPALGDVNEDGKFNIPDVIMLQKWLLGSDEIGNWKAGDFCGDGILNAFDLALMKRELLS
ncbi:MAG: glycoside hydrolase N-terminal domain-containing protein [Oscillospiraceae bacterium]|nr:glycoside hydrolase N-terminal domain-containing protein [Oscillospiraceae bacterium]